MPLTNKKGTITFVLAPPLLVNPYQQSVKAEAKVRTLKK